MQREIVLSIKDELFILSMKTPGGTFRTIGLEYADILSRYNIKAIDEITEKKMIFESAELVKKTGIIVFASDVKDIVREVEKNRIY
ncbi:hypothetical protein [Marinifilum flexuosum]|uniref:hypothetical protein n=1 Tax=Marinifilum flexuosum TaxID=1117708 RepID=UPI002494F4B7|nr:hypothetical protein [Marinifilum flexuosum]